jgi:hypothetical protein
MIERQKFNDKAARLCKAIDETAECRQGSQP